MTKAETASIIAELTATVNVVTDVMQQLCNLRTYVPESQEPCVTQIYSRVREAYCRLSGLMRDIRLTQLTQHEPLVTEKLPINIEHFMRRGSTRYVLAVTDKKQVQNRKVAIYAADGLVDVINAALLVFEHRQYSAPEVWVVRGRCAYRFTETLSESADS